MKKILILASNPKGDLQQIDSEIRDLKAAIKRNKDFIVEIEPAVQAQDIQKHFHEYHPYIVHFCGHGAGEDGLVLDQGKLISNNALSGLFKIFGEEIECVLLNACTTEIQANAIGEYVPYVIGTSREILDRAAYLFAVGFYEGLGYGETIERCYELGCNAIEIGLNKVQLLRLENSETPRKLEVVAQEGTKVNSEPLKIILKINSSVTTSDLPANIPPKFQETILEEVDRKDYYDNLRNVLECFGQTSIEREKPISKFEYEQRQTFLKKVQEFWIEGFLKPSLYFNTATDKDIDHSSVQILRPLEKLEVISFDIDKSYDELQQTDIMGQISDGKTLLILGDPGSGKTVALLQLAERLIKLTQQDMTKPIPVVFNLSSWGQKQQPLEEWLIEELKDKYQVPKTWSKPWIKDQQLILLLDGLDEVKSQHRNACVRAINKFIAEHLETEIVVCSRVKDYEALTERLLLSSVICIQPLSQKQLLDFLENADDSLLGLKTVIERDREIAEFAQTPLILNMMTWTYQGWSAAQCHKQFWIAKDREFNLFESYIEKNLDREDVEKKYPRDKVLYWLNWLGQIMVKESKTVFLIEKMQSSFLSSATEQYTYHILVGLIVGLILGIAAGADSIYLSNFYMKDEWSSKFIPIILTSGILSGLISGSVFGILCIFNIKKLRKVFTSGFIIALTNTIILKFTIFDKWSLGEFSKNISRLFFLIFMLASAVYYLIHEEIKPIENIKFNSDRIKQIKQFAILGFLVGVLYVLIRFILKSYDYSSDPDYLYNMLFEILVCVIVFAIIGGFIIKNEIFQLDAEPNEGIKKGGVYALISFVIVVPVSTLIIWISDQFICSTPNSCPYLNPVYSIYTGFALGLLGWLCGGGGSGIVLIQHSILRFMLHRQGRISRNYAQFLDYAKDLRLLKKVGGGYVFYHRMLMEHFARKKID